MKKNLPIIIGIILPILVVLIIFISVSLSKVDINPEHDFIFSVRDQDYEIFYKNEYKIQENKIILSPNILNNSASKSSRIEKEAPTLYLYSPRNEFLKEITFEEAQKLVLDNGPMSPDGYYVNFNYRENWGLANEIFGNNNSYDNVFILKENRAKGYYLPLNDRYYYNREFVGWVISQ